MTATHTVTFEEACKAIEVLLRHLGENPSREGLLDTPHRVVKAWQELVGGYHLDPHEILSTTFDLGDVEEGGALRHVNFVISKNLPFVSYCEHHMLPFEGEAHLAYVPQPGGRVVGLSKLARLLDAYARRFQVQERLTEQLAGTLDRALQPMGVAIMVEASHSCQCARGIRKKGRMVTTAYTGIFQMDAASRQEFLQLVKP
ncbi:GTP cyclohydrolase I FolE [Deinococcus cellulosilyticus]|uniref:GTP cyclohydrolase 1 n=1 Tax=Deinococcus cellulosilyticus (strain DSM 18568 / NBRC 106333 / KACC 11606 / 5516J-15) TaxID=1223518 RepID=A0A511MZU9_DEIC1|nr:GTP cyclohydrolase I FolE [Deinococcus cellulosilyticus]GEM46145.1 GTP cyclohydrolase 1 [Deinococcus cellulosilyticus NBRC 106333 = KACC 11606]